jgi:hypothetical protein
MASMIANIRARLRSLAARVRRIRQAIRDPGYIDRDARTLQHWREQFAGPERTIECREMRLTGRDYEGDVFTGPGRIVIDDNGIRFYLYGTAADEPTAFRKYLSARAKPYEALEQFRLIATDYRGTSWTGGYTSVDFFTDHERGWPLSGELLGLSTLVSDFWVSKTAGIEMLLMPAVDLPMDEAMETSTRIGGEPVFWSRGSGRQRLKALGSSIDFERDPSERALWITATMSPHLQPVFAERWLAEPLRIMLGALVYPRLMARNFGDGTADVTFLPAPAKRRPSIFGLMQPFAASAQPGRNQEFWRLYVDILTMIGNALDYHEVTRLYEELIQTQKASRWVISMTLASTVEALARSIMTDADRTTEYKTDALDSMRDHLRAWKGDDRLRARMLDSVAFASRRGIAGFMFALARAGKLDSGQVETWQKLRNSVMHGELTEPWSTEEGDTHMRELIALTHALTRLRIAKG